MAMSSCNYDIVIDSDRDGTPDDEDACPNDPGLQIDTGTCGCNLRLVNGKCVYMGLEDSDADGVPNDNDACPDDPKKISPGVCGCGIPDGDSDGDDTPDCLDECPNDANKTQKGYCGCGAPETDSDNDTIPDCADECDSNPRLIVESPCGCDDSDDDKDGTLNCVDECPNDPLKKTPGICGCGVSDSLDSDEDGLPNCIDGCPLDPLKKSPGVCGCGTPDADSDSDGVLDCLDPCPLDPLKSTSKGFCGCGVPDVDENHNMIYDCNEACASSPIGKETYGYCGCSAEDTDSDGDTLPDCVDQCPDSPIKVAPGICGCDIADTDSDLDGVLDCNDTCPMDRSKTDNVGICGCNPSLQYDEQYDDTFDSDGDGTPDCIDECPYDATRQRLVACECASAGLDREIGGKWVCVEKGGVIQADYTLYHTYSLLPDNTHKSAADAYKNRRITTPRIHLSYLPGGNLLTNPAFEYNSEGWNCDDTYSTTFQTMRFEEETISRPFAKYPVLTLSHVGEDFSQDIRLPTISVPSTFTAGVFAYSQSYPNQPNDPLSISISLPSTYASFDGDADRNRMLFTSVATVLYPSDSDQTVTVQYSGSDSSGWAGHYGTQLQYFAAWLGDREIRFSNDGEHWTEWKLFFPNHNGTSTSGYYEDWDLVNLYGGNDEPGLKTVYMQTHDLFNDKYYHAEDTFIYYPPKEGGEIFIGASPITSKGLTTKEEVVDACSMRTISSTKTTVAFVPGGNLLQNATFIDSNNEDTSAEGWKMEGASVLWRSETSNEPSRHIPNTPVVSLSTGGSYIEQDIDISGYTNDKYYSLSFSSFASGFGKAAVSLSPIKDGVVLESDILTQDLSYTYGKSVATNYNPYWDRNNPSGNVDTIRYRIAIPDSVNVPVRLDGLYFTLGESFVRFSYDNRQTWTRWIKVSDVAAEHTKVSISRDNYVLNNVTLQSNGDNTATVYMQTYNQGTDEYYETSETVRTSF